MDENARLIWLIDWSIGVSATPHSLFSFLISSSISIKIDVQTMRTFYANLSNNERITKFKLTWKSSIEEETHHFFIL